MASHGKGQRKSLGKFHGKPISTKVVHSIRKSQRENPRIKGR